MKVVHFTNNLFDGAGRAAYRIHEALLGEGVESLMLVSREGESVDSDTVIEFSGIHSRPTNNLSEDILQRGAKIVPLLARKLYWRLELKRWKPLTLFNLNIPFVSLRKLRKYLHGVDIICLYSIQQLLSPRLIKDIYFACKAPIIWTLMDIEPLTGGCHFSSGCMRFTRSCGNCPKLGRGTEKDISHHIWHRKKTNLSNIPIAFVAASSKICEHVSRSSLFGENQIRKILLSVDKTICDKIDKNVARSELNLPEADKIILFGGFNLDDSRHGGKYLLEALKRMPDHFGSNGDISDQITLVTIGRKNGFDASGIPFKWIHLGEIKDDRSLSLIYHSSDVLACPTIDSFGPMMINEAFACGTMVVSFESDVGVASDFLVSDEAGYLVEKFNVEELSLALFRCLFEKRKVETSSTLNYLRKACKPSFQAREYTKLFQELLSRDSSSSILVRT